MWEQITAKLTALLGFDHRDSLSRNGVPFSRTLRLEEICHRLHSSGYPGMGREPMYSGMTGMRLDGDVYIGIVYYQRLHAGARPSMRGRAVEPDTWCKSFCVFDFPHSPPSFFVCLHRGVRGVEGIKKDDKFHARALGPMRPFVSLARAHDRTMLSTSWFVFAFFHVRGVHPTMKKSNRWTTHRRQSASRRPTYRRDGAGLRSRRVFFFVAADGKHGVAE